MAFEFCFSPIAGDPHDHSCEQLARGVLVIAQNVPCPDGLAKAVDFEHV